MLFTVIWRQTYGKGPFREQDRKPAATTWATLSDQQQDLYASSHSQDNTYHTAFVIPVVVHWLEREIAQWVHHGGSIRRPITP